MRARRAPVVRRKLAAALLGLGAVPAALVALPGAASAGYIGATGGAGYAVISLGQAMQPDPSFVPLASYQFASSSAASGASVAHKAVGRYTVVFRNVLPAGSTGALGVAHARPTGASVAAACYASRPQPDGIDPGTTPSDAGIDVSCWNLNGDRVNGQFVVMWGRGGTEEGALASARFRPSGSSLVAEAPTSSIGGLPYGVRNGTGNYYVWVHRDTDSPGYVNKEGLQVSSATVGTTCSVKNGWSPDGILLRVEVGCVRFNGFGPADASFDLSYTGPVSVLGMLYGASDAHATFPLMTGSTPVIPQVQRSRIYGAAGGVIVAARTGVGSYEVRLTQQAEGTAAGSTVVTAFGSDARCREANAWTVHDTATYDRIVLVTCVDTYGSKVDTAFYLQHTARQ
jgi:hypothetical protein